jgi:1,4-dihydroxy-2-naphthoyl-CoA hydrolase
MTDLSDLRQFPGLDSLLGIEIVEATGSRVVLTWEVTPALHQPFGIMHGGVHCSAVESAASMGAAFWYGDRGTVVGVANHTNFLRAVRDGRLTATAEPIHQGGLQQLWLVNITDEADRLVARGEVRLQNLAKRD